MAESLDKKPRHGASQDGTDLSLEALYDTYGGRVLNLAYRLTANEDTAHDMAQDIWLKVYQGLDGFDGRAQVFTWIYRIAVNHILNHLKREKRSRWVDLMDRTIGDVVRADIGRSHPAPDSSIEMEERAGTVWRFVQTLDPKYRVPLVLHYYEELSYRDIAETIGLSLAAVEARIHRAKRQLIKKLGPLVDAL